MYHKTLILEDITKPRGRNNEYIKKITKKDSRVKTLQMVEKEMNKITIRIVPNSNIEIFLSVVNEEVPIYCCTKNNLEMWK